MIKSLPGTLPPHPYGEKTMPTIKISGMRCGHCSAAVAKALNAIEGVTEVIVDLDHNEASYTEKEPVPLATIKAAITKIGFEVV